MKKKLPQLCPKESEEQESLFRWAEWERGKHPELALLHHIANGGTRNPIEASHLKAQGVKAGVPDLCLPVARGQFHGLYIELKRRQGGMVSDDQKKWIKTLREQGYVAEVCRGWEQAAEMITKYLELR